jgi:hypothetical protein
MPVEIKWCDTDPETGQRRFLCVHKFAGQWWFKSKLLRRGEWREGLQPTIEMWEHVLDSLEKRYRRREGVSDEDVDKVRRIVEDLRRKLAEEEGD